MQRQNIVDPIIAGGRRAAATVLALMVLTACSGPLEPTGPQMPDGLSGAQLDSAEDMVIDVRGLSQERAAALIAAAEAAAAAPGDVDAAIWHGRQLAYCSRFEEAVEVYTAAADRLEARLARLRIAPEALPRLQAEDGMHRILRHRGHRLITLRRFAPATVDLQRAARLAELVPDRVEPDGLPNATGVPRSTSHTNIYYHLGLAHLLLGKVPQARDAWSRCLGFSTNDDMLVAAAWWLFCCELRLGDREAAADILASIRPEMDVVENQSYHSLLRWVKGELTIDDLGVTGPAANTAPDNEIATLAGGIGLREFSIGEQLTARRWYRLARNRSVNAFGAIVAETELARMGFGP